MTQMADTILETALIQRTKALAEQTPEFLADVRDTALATIADTCDDGIATRDFVDGVLATAFNMGMLFTIALGSGEASDALEDLVTLTAFSAWEIAAVYSEAQA